MKILQVVDFLTLFGVFVVLLVSKPLDRGTEKAVELIENRTLKEHGLDMLRFVEKYNWDDVVSDFGGFLGDAIRGE